MVQSIVATFVALLCWAKVSKNIEERTQLSSITKTLIIGVFTVIVLVFYIKTYQVATILTSINVNSYAFSVDSTGNITDSIEGIRITNNFSSDLIETSYMKKDIYSQSWIEPGVAIGQQWRNDNKTDFNENESLNHLRNKGWGFPLDKKLYNHFYEIDVLRTTIPSFIPFLPSQKGMDPVRYPNLLGGRVHGNYEFMKFYNEFETNIRKIYVDGYVETVDGENEKALRNTYSAMCILGDTVKVDTTQFVLYTQSAPIGNSLNFFTAADISQYTQAITINSPCYVKSLVFQYNLPIEINPYDSCMKVTSHSFGVTGDYLNKDIVNKGGTFHVKLPTLSNLQLIRSLILTTLLTALVALFFANLFYLIRKYALKFMEKHKEQVSEVRMKKFRTKVYILLVIFIAVVLYVTWRICIDKPFFISENIYVFLSQYYGWVIFILVALVFVLICYLFRKVLVSPKNKKR